MRRALSLMIDRKLIVDRLLDGSGEPAGQMVPQGIGGYDPALDAAKAGYGDSQESCWPRPATPRLRHHLHTSPTVSPR